MASGYAKYSGLAGSGGGTGTVTSVGLADGSTVPIYGITGSPVTSAGTLTFSLASQSAHAFLAGPLTGTAQPTFRAIVSGDLPTGNLTDAGTDGIAVTGGSGAVIGSGTSIAQHVADASHNGYLSSADWSTFNGKQAALTIGNLTSTPTTNLVVTGGTGAVIGTGALLTLTGASIVEATSSVLTISGATNAVLGTGVSIQVKQAATSQSGYLSSTDWNTFNGKQAAGNYITALTGDGAASGPGSAALTLATVNSNVGSFGSATAIPAFTVNGKGLIIAASSNALVFPGSYSYSGYYVNSSSNYWSGATSGSYADFTVQGTIPSITTLTNSNFGTVSNATSNLPGVNITAPRTGKIRVTFVVTMFPTGAASTTTYAIQLLESTTSTAIAYISGYQQNVAAEQWGGTATLMGYFSATASTVYNFKLQEQSSAGVSLSGFSSFGTLLNITMEYVS